MAEVATLRQHPFQDDFARLQRDEPGFLSEFRQAGRQRFERLGLPNRRQESWRFTDLGDFAGRNFMRTDGSLVDTGRLPERLADGPRLVFVNGRFQASLSHLEPLPRGVTVLPLGTAMQEQPALVERHLGRAPALASQPFAALNDALLQDGVLVHVGSGKSLEQPLELVYYSEGTDSACYPRNLIVLEKSAQLQVVEDHRGHGGYLTCPQTELLLERGANCRYHKMQQEAADGLHVGSLRLSLAAEAQLVALLLNAGGRVNRTDVMASLEGAGADCRLHGLSLAEDGELADYHVQVEHRQPDGSSRQQFKGVLNGKSRAVFDGLIKVVEKAQKTDASQSSRNLLLSQRALVNTNPRLEILADDVKCAHGATVGFLDPDALFYLRSRGVDAEQARAMLVFAFANEQLEALNLPGLRERLEALLSARYFPDAL